jgi:hypothetical protein
VAGELTARHAVSPDGGGTTEKGNDVDANATVCGSVRERCTKSTTSRVE